MDERQIPRVAKAALALVILFGLGSLLYNSGYSSGMVTGMLVSGSEGGATNPYLLSQMGGMHGGFGFFGGILRFGFLLVFLAVIAKFFGFARWKMRMQHNFSSNGGEAGNGSSNFHPMWEMHRKWHQAEEQAQQPVSAPATAAPTERPAPAAPQEPSAEEK